MPLSVSPPMGGVSFPYGVYCSISGGIYYHSSQNMSIFIFKAFSIVLGIRLPTDHRERLKA